LSHASGNGTFSRNQQATTTRIQPSMSLILQGNWTLPASVTMKRCVRTIVLHTHCGYFASIMLMLREKWQKPLAIWGVFYRFSRRGRVSCIPPLIDQQWGSDRSARFDTQEGLQRLGRVRIEDMVGVRRFSKGINDLLATVGIATRPFLPAGGGSHRRTRHRETRRGEGARHSRFPAAVAHCRVGPRTVGAQPSAFQNGTTR
jgi:hypothetical protein